MKKKILSFLLAVVMIVGILPLGVIPVSAAEEVYHTDVIIVNNSTFATSENGHFQLEADSPSLSGWTVCNPTPSFSDNARDIKIRAVDGQTITRIDIVVSSTGNNYGNVEFSRGRKVQDGPVSNYSTVSVTDINATEVTIYNTVSYACTLGNIMVYYNEALTEYYALDVGAGAYIDTEFTPDKDTRIVMDVELNNQAVALFGCILNWGNTHNFYVNAGGDSEYGPSGYGSGYGNAARWAKEFAPVEGRQRVELNKNEFKVNDVVKDTFDYGDFSGQSMYLFGIHIDDWAQTFENQFIRFYFCKIYKGNELKREFVPAKLGNEFGVYDRVEKKFYKNQNDGYMVGYQKATPQSGLPRGITNEGVILDFDGEITVSENTTISGQPGQSGIVIAGGRNVTININNGIELNVTGGEGVGRYGAGAGIEVPDTSSDTSSDTTSLTVCGFGTLNATGGDAAVGEVGGRS